MMRKEIGGVGQAKPTQRPHILSYIPAIPNDLRYRLCRNCRGEKENKKPLKPGGVMLNEPFR
jgi:hypothetical protein